MALSVYDPKSVILVAPGAGLISGFADGTFVTIEFNEDDYTLVVGSDGNGTRSRTNNKSGRITFTLMQSSHSNDDLLILRNNTINGNQLALPAGDVTVKEPRFDGSSLTYTAVTAWIAKYPNTEYAREATSREWIFETDELNIKIEPAA